MSKKFQERFEDYLQNEKHPEFLAAAQALADNEKELQERFSDDLEFGTGGLRGLIGPGSNRINPYTIARSSQGLATYAKSIGNDGMRAVVSYDSRRYSRDFAREAACVFAANGITTYLFDSLHPVPLLSFAVRHCHAQFGVMITASHNPPEYNGYKVYWDDGAQVLPPHDAGIIEAIRQVTDIHSMSSQQAESDGLLAMIQEEMDEAYQKAIAPLVVRKDLIAKEKDKFTIVYTPLHGSGFIPVQQALEGNDFSLLVVQEQAAPDGNFPTVKTPNPEDPKALSIAIKLATKYQAGLVMATDPDADRLGVAVRHEGNYVPLTGNQIGAILLNYLASRHKEFGTMPPQPYFVNSIVSSTLHNEIARFYGIQDYRVLTGFKYVAEKIRSIENSGENASFLFACEESYGYLCTTVVRDKDAVSAAMVLAECAVWNYSQGRTLLDYMRSIYEQFGYFKEGQVSAEFPGSSGKLIMQNLMTRLRGNDHSWCHAMIVSIIDYATGETWRAGKKERNITLPPSDVLEFHLEDGTVMLARPSGTEPKIKFYLLIKGKDAQKMEETMENLKSDISGLLSGFSILG